MSGVLCLCTTVISSGTLCSLTIISSTNCGDLARMLCNAVDICGYRNMTGVKHLVNLCTVQQLEEKNH